MFRVDVGGLLLDPFLATHTRIKFRDTGIVKIRGKVLDAAETLAVRQIPYHPPDELVHDGAQIRRLVLYYNMMAEALLAASDIDLEHRTDRLVAEVVALHRLLDVLRMNERGTGLRKSVLGWLIQDRLCELLLQTGNSGFNRLWRIRDLPGIDRDDWEVRLTGAAGEAMAMRGIALLPEARVFPSLAFEDIVLGVDFYVRAQGASATACVSVKTRTSTDTVLHLTDPGNVNGDWTRVARGAEPYRNGNGAWIPALLTIGKAYGEAVNLGHPDPPKWAKRLLAELTTM